MLNEALVLVSEIVLSAYPSLIKLVDTSVLLQIGLRMVVFTGLAIVAAFTTGNPVAAATLFSAEKIYTGLLNLLHLPGLEYSRCGMVLWRIPLYRYVAVDRTCARRSDWVITSHHAPLDGVGYSHGTRRSAH